MAQIDPLQQDPNGGEFDEVSSADIDSMTREALTPPEAQPAAEDEPLTSMDTPEMIAEAEQDVADSWYLRATDHELLIQIALTNAAIEEHVDRQATAFEKIADSAVSMSQRFEKMTPIQKAKLGTKLLGGLGGA